MLILKSAMIGWKKENGSVSMPSKRGRLNAASFGSKIGRIPISLPFNWVLRHCFILVGRQRLKAKQLRNIHRHHGESFTIWFLSSICINITSRKNLIFLIKSKFYFCGAVFLVSIFTACLSFLSRNRYSSFYSNVLHSILWSIGNCTSWLLILRLFVLSSFSRALQ